MKGTWIVAAACVSALALTAEGCIGSTSDETSTGNAAVDAALPALSAALRDRNASDLPAAITSVTVGTVANPWAASTPTGVVTGTLAVAGVTVTNSVDGTVPVVAATVDTAWFADGSGDQAIAVVQDPGTHTYLSASVVWNPPSISYLAPDFAFAGLDAVTGEGQALVVARIVYSGSLTRTIANVAPNGATLFTNLSGGTPASRRSAIWQGFQDFLVEFSITDVAGELQATVAAVRAIDSGSTFAGAEVVSQIDIDFATDVVVNDGTLAAAFRPYRHLLIPVGSDATTTGFDSDANVGTTFDVIGGVNGQGTRTDVYGAFVGSPALSASTLKTVVVDEDLDPTVLTAPPVDDGTIQHDLRLTIASTSTADASTDQHALDGTWVLADLRGDLVDALFLPSETSVSRIATLLH